MQFHGIDGSDSFKQRRRDVDVALHVPSGSFRESLHSESLCLEDAAEMSQKLEHVEALRDFYVWWTFNAACLRRRQQDAEEGPQVSRRNSIPEVPMHTMNSGTSTAATTTATSNTSRQDSFGSTFATNGHVELAASLPDAENVHGVKTNCHRHRAKSLTPTLGDIYGSQPRPWTLSCFLFKTGSVRRSFIHFEAADLLFHKFPTRFLSRFAVQEPNGLFLEHERANPIANIAGPQMLAPPFLPPLSQCPIFPPFGSLEASRADLGTDHLETCPAAVASTYGVPSYPSSSTAHLKPVFAPKTRLNDPHCAHDVENQTPIGTFYGNCVSPSTLQRFPDTPSAPFPTLCTHGEVDCLNSDVPLTSSCLPKHPTTFSCDPHQMNDQSLAPNLAMPETYGAFLGSEEASLPPTTNTSYNGKLETVEHSGWIQSSSPYRATLGPCCSTPANLKEASLGEPQVTVPGTIWVGSQPLQYPMTLETPELQRPFIQCYTYPQNSILGHPEVLKADEPQVSQVSNPDLTRCPPRVLEKLPSRWIEPSSHNSYPKARVLSSLPTQPVISEQEATVVRGEAVGQTEMMSEKKSEGYLLSVGNASCSTNVDKKQPLWPTHDSSGLKPRRFFHAARRPHFRGGPPFHPPGNVGKKGGFEHSRPPVHRHTFAPSSQFYSWRRPWTPRHTSVQHGPEADYPGFKVHGYGRDSSMQTERSGYPCATYFHADRNRKFYMYAPSGLQATKPEVGVELSATVSCSTSGHGNAECQVTGPEEGKTNAGRRFATERRNATITATGHPLSHEQYWIAYSADRKPQSSQSFARREKMNSGFVHAGRPRPSGPTSLQAPPGAGFPRGFRYTLPRGGGNPGQLHRDYKGRAGKENKKGKTVALRELPDFASKADTVSVAPQDAAKATICTEANRIQKQGSEEATLRLEKKDEVSSSAPLNKNPISAAPSQQPQHDTILNASQAMTDTVNDTPGTKDGAFTQTKQTKPEHVFHQRQSTSVATLGPPRQERHRGRRKPYIHRSLTVGADANGRILHVSELGEVSAGLKKGSRHTLAKPLTSRKERLGAVERGSLNNTLPRNHC